jgi:molybdopterin-guanine dinucleotide biosynthesis protein A
MKNGWTGVVLAGGKSSRMGRDKALIEVDGRTLLDRALDRLEPLTDELLVIGDPKRYGHVGPFVIADETPDLGPIGGLVTAMRFATNDKLLVMACDLPSITEGLLLAVKERMGNFTDAVVPVHQDRMEPLCAAYHRRCETTLRQAIAREDFKMQDVLQQLRVDRLMVQPGEGKWPIDLFRNLNQPADL